MNPSSHATSGVFFLDTEMAEAAYSPAPMIGTQLIEELVQSVALSHRIKGHKRVSLLLLAAPESGKTTIVNAATAKHVCRIAVITARSILKEVNDNPHTEYLLFNDLTAIRAMSAPAVNLLIVILNQMTQDEHGVVAFAGKEKEEIKRAIGVIACLPFLTFSDHRARWRELGFVSRMVPFAYEYPAEIIAEIKDTIDSGLHLSQKQPLRKLPAVKRSMMPVACPLRYTRAIRAIADARATELRQLGIRLLQNYHCLVRSRAVLFGRSVVDDSDLRFLRAVDRYVSITKCEQLQKEDEHYGEAFTGRKTRNRVQPVPESRRREERRHARVHRMESRA